MPYQLKHSDLKAETLYYPQKTLDPRSFADTTEERHVFRLRHGVTIDLEMSMLGAVNSLEETLKDSDNVENLAVQGLKNYLGAMVPARRAGAFRTVRATWLSSREWGDFQDACNRAEESDPVEFVGQALDARDFVNLTHYMMTHTPLQDEARPGVARDPRLDLIDRIKGGKT